ncbi:MAG: alpha-amylase family glycosyl hydrolase [Salinibacter sp.]
MASCATGFWADWHTHVRSINPEAYTVAEVWEEASGFLRESGFSATMNYHGFAYPVKGFLIDNAIDPSTFADLMQSRRQTYAPAVRPALLNLIDSHDTPRLATMLVNRADTGYARPNRFDYDWGGVVDLRQNPDYNVRGPGPTERRLQRLIALTQMTTPGMPMIYHGTEAGMWGADDPDDRKPMVWPDRTYEVEDSHPYGDDRPADSVRFRHDLFDTYRSLIGLRTEHTALRRGASTPLAADDERQMLAYARSHADAPTLITVLNRSDEAHSIRIPLPDSLQADYEPVVQTPRDGAVRVQQDASALLLDLPPHAGLLLRETDS